MVYQSLDEAKKLLGPVIKDWKQQAQDKISELEKINPVDDISIGLYTEKLKELRIAADFSEDYRKTQTAPFRAAQGFVNDTFKELDFLHEFIEKSKKKLQEAEKAQKKRRADDAAKLAKQAEDKRKEEEAALARNKELAQRLIDFVQEVKLKINQAMSAQDLQAITQTYLNNPPDFGIYHDKLVTNIEELRNYGRARWQSIKAGNVQPPAEEMAPAANLQNELEEDLKLQQIKIDANDKQAQANIGMTMKSSVVTRKVLKFGTRIPGDVSDVDRKYLTLDTDKVNKLIIEPKREEIRAKLDAMIAQGIQNPKLAVGGIHIYYEESVSL